VMNDFVPSTHFSLKFYNTQKSRNDREFVFQLRITRQQQ